MKKYILLTSLLILLISSFTYLQFQSVAPKVSVLMPTYNRAHRVQAAIDSILNQTYKDFEFIIVNDGSSDKTADVLNTIKNKDKRIIVLTNTENKGITFSLNRALKIARGKYIVRMDDDDVSLPYRFEKQIDYLDKHPDIAVLGSAIKIPQTDKVLHLAKNEHEAKILSYFQVPVYHPTTMIRRSFLKDHNITYEKKYDAAEDTAFWYRIIQEGGKITNYPEPLVIQDIYSPKNYSFHKQADSFNHFIRMTLKPFFEKEELNQLSYPLSHKKFCFIIKRFHENNFFDEEALKSLSEKYCY